jgi:hypothetical protein
MKQRIAICGFILMLVLSGTMLADTAADKNAVYKTLTLNDVARLMKKGGFFSKCYDWNREYCNPEGDFANDYKAETLQGQPVVLDRKSGLMWHRGGTYKSLRFKDAEAWVEGLNRSGYAGFKDWRLPTLREAATLLENRKKNGPLYIDAVFSKEQGWIWTGDICSSSGGWVVTFLGGTVAKPGYGLYFVRPVRTL